MNVCDICGRKFKFPYLLIRHLNRTVSCSTIEKSKPTYKKVDLFYKKVDQNYKKVDQIYKKVDLEFSCEKCSKILKSKQGLQKHSDVCKGVDTLQCPSCLKVFSNKYTKCRHMKKGKCVSHEMTSIVDFEEEIESLKKENAILKASSRTTSIVNSNNKTINNSIIYYINYNPETKCMTTDDPMAPVQELLCLNGFRLEALKANLKDINMNDLQFALSNIRRDRNYDSFYRFLFRNLDNKRLQMFSLGRNNNSTHAHVFNNGSIEAMDKTLLFENITKYISQYLINLSIDNVDIIGMLINDPASKKSFIEISKSSSSTFDYYKKNDNNKQFLLQDRR